jgi:hypothetical protein
MDATNRKERRKRPKWFILVTPKFVRYFPETDGMETADAGRTLGLAYRVVAAG